jgi:hypothetical protein
MYIVLSYIVIVIYLFFVVLRSSFLSKWINDVFFNTRFLIIFERIIYTTNLCMSWGMFSISPPSYNRIKIIIETYDNQIKVFYLEELEIQKLIPELKLSISCQSVIINNYMQFSDFMNDFFIDKFKKIYPNIKYLQIYNLVYSSQLRIECLNFDKDQSKMTFFYEYK